MNLTIKRLHGLGNVLQLLPVVEATLATGAAVNLITKKNYFEIFDRLDFDVSKLKLFEPDAFLGKGQKIIDLDARTSGTVSTKARVDEFASLIGIAPLRRAVGVSRSKRFPNGYPQNVGIAPEAGNSARVWNYASVNRLVQALKDGRDVYILGEDVSSPEIPGAFDIRGKTSLAQLIDFLEGAEFVITMDSAVMHLCGCMNIPCVALFGSIDPRLRMLDYPSVVALVPLPLSQMPNKDVSKEAQRPIDDIQPKHVLNLLDQINAQTEIGRIYLTLQPDRLHRIL